VSIASVTVVSVPTVAVVSVLRAVAVAKRRCLLPDGLLLLLPTETVARAEDVLVLMQFMLPVVRAMDVLVSTVLAVSVLPALASNKHL